MTHKITNANIKEWAANYDGPLFDGILCDPPYELGFMGKSWDSSGIAFDADMWADILKLLKPGGHLLAFSGSRTYHRMAVAIEDAGFEPRDMLVYCYGSGFPKSLNIGKAVDRLQGNEREDLGISDNNRDRSKHEYNSVGNVGSNARVTKGKSEWEGYGTALKPAIEPIILARKPISEKNIALNVLKHGTGGLNIDGTRIPTMGKDLDKLNGEWDRTWENDWLKQRDSQEPNYPGWKPRTGVKNNVTGRFPANLILSDDPEVEAVFPQTKSGGGNKGNVKNGTGMFGSGKAFDTPNVSADSGSASRFFYTAKASKSERNAGLEGLPEDIGVGNYMSDAKWINDPRHKDGGYLAAPSKPQANHHPTVKPLSLTKYLATLIKPPTGGRLLVPFSGSGSEMIGALQAGWEYVEGVELTEEYIPIAEARIRYWINNIKVNKDGTISPVDPKIPARINISEQEEQVALL